MVTWAELAAGRPDLAEAGARLLYQHGVGLGFLATTRADGGPRVHPICPVMAGNPYAFIVPGPKLADLRPDPPYALCPDTCPPPPTNDKVSVTGTVQELDEPPFPEQPNGQP